MAYEYSAFHSQAEGSQITTRSGTGHLGRTMSTEGNTPKACTRARGGNGHKGYIETVTSPRAVPAPETTLARALPRPQTVIRPRAAPIPQVLTGTGRTRTGDGDKPDGRAGNREARGHTRLTRIREGIEDGNMPKGCTRTREANKHKGATGLEMVTKPRVALGPRMASGDTKQRQ